LNVHGFNDIRQTEIHTAEPRVPEPSVFAFELATENLKYHKSTGIDKIPASLYLSIRGVIKQIVLITGAYHFCQLRTKFYPTFCSQG
jgi:hypothetical protein